MRSIVLCLLLLASGCYRTTIIDRAPGERPARVGVTVRHTFIHGLIAPGAVELDHACGDGGHWMAIHEQMTALNSLAFMVTLGLYTPRAVNIYCAAAQRPSAAARRARLSADHTSAVR